MRNYELETKWRVAFIRKVIADAGAKGIVFGNSGGKDCTLTGILCKMACDDTVGVIMPCGTKQNYGSDKADAELIAKQYNIESRYVDLTATRDGIMDAMDGAVTQTNEASANMAIAPRLRMVTLFTIASSENRLVAGTGNRSESYMGYFTKWGDGAYDFNPIIDLTVTEVYEFLRHLDAPEAIVNKAPSAGLVEGQTDEGEMGISYEAIDNFLLNGTADARVKGIMDEYHKKTEHKRQMPLAYTPQS